MRLTDVSSCSAHCSEGARTHVGQQQEHPCTNMHGASEWESWPALIKALCLICCTLKTGTSKRAGANSCGHVPVSPTLKRFSTVVSKAKDGVSQTARRERVSLGELLLWQSEEHSEADAALRACTKGFSPPLKASHCSFGALKCWYCFPLDFCHAFCTKSPRGGDKKEMENTTIGSNFNQRWSLNNFIKPITIAALLLDETLCRDLSHLRLD